MGPFKPWGWPPTPNLSLKKNRFFCDLVKDDGTNGRYIKRLPFSLQKSALYNLWIVPPIMHACVHILDISFMLNYFLFDRKCAAFQEFRRRFDMASDKNNVRYVVQYFQQGVSFLVKFRVFSRQRYTVSIRV